GCGTGQLSLPLARQGAHVMAVDVSRAMVDLLEVKAAASRLTGILGVVTPIETLSLPEQSVDLVVSNYALHHLRDRDKAAVVVAAASWLRSGGRLVAGDMMFGRGGTARDRTIIAEKVAILARRGPAGWWRLAKNALRFTLRFQERPVSMDTWKRYFEIAGLTDVSATPIVSEAAVIVGTKP
ncbi:MAG TPA: class I SAM-dependent methyltransferase, partial [Acidimicrobiales bacterium]